jgi:hypothetical protein
MKKEINKKIIWSVAGVIVLVVTFYGGMQYGGNNVRSAINSRGQNGISGQYGGMRGIRNGGGFTIGEILSKDAQSITLKMQDGGSKIIFYTDSTKVSKTIDGTTADLSVGKQVTITGTSNPDGSISAESVQIRPIITSTK